MVAIGLSAGAVARIRHLHLYARSTAQLDRLQADPATGLAQLATEIEQFWRDALAPEWPRIRGRAGMTAGGVSQHLAALRAAGLVVTHRQGRSVLNVRTALAEALLSSAPPLSAR